MQLAPQRIGKDPQEMAAANKSREMEERERRRKDTARPTSLAPPSIVSNTAARSDEKTKEADAAGI